MNELFEYIIVGAGSAGCVLANRLVQQGKQVLLLEAGPSDWHPLVHMPSGVSEVLKNKQLNWQYYSSPQARCNNKKYYVPRGKISGGSSSVNGMVCIRGHRADYDAWEKAGNKGWSYEEVLPYFKSIENWSGGDNAYHSTQGELTVNQTTTQNPLFDYFIAAGQEAGLKLNNDFNGAEQAGVGRYDANIHNGRRFSGVDAFLKPIKKHKNFTLMNNAEVSKIHFRGHQAVGLTTYIKGRQQDFRATKEIILCSGTVNNPKLLIQSGIGESTQLKKIGVPLVHDLPGVGKNLQEHLGVYMCYPCNQPITLNGLMESKLRQAMIGLQYFTTRKGIGAGNQLEVGAFWYSDKNVAHPDIQLHFIPGLVNSIISDLPAEHGLTLRACNLRPKSRGEITVTSSDYKTTPVIAFNFLDNPDDLKVLIAAYKLVNTIMKADAWQGMIGPELYSPSTEPTDTQIEAFARQNSETDFHLVGTCKMGHDRLSVVDDQLRVRGIEGLRIADASIMPTLISGNTSLPAMMIGAKAAAMIANREPLPIAQSNKSETTADVT